MFSIVSRLLFAGLLLFVTQTGVWASCGSATCPLDTRSADVREKGQIRIGYEFEYIDQDEPRISTRRAAVGQIHGHHDEVRTTNRIHRWTASAGVTDRLSLDIGLPLISRSHTHVHAHHGALLHEQWDFTELGDLSLQARYAVYKPELDSRPTLSVLGGVEFPTGKSRITNAGGDEAEPGITPGSASWDGVIGGVSLQHVSVPSLGGAYAAMPLFVSVTYKINGKGHEDYRLGNILSANTGVIYPVVKWMGVIQQFNLIVREKDERGLTGEEIEKTGGESLFYSPGLRFLLADAWEWSTLVQVPVRQRVNQIQLTAPYHLQTSLSYRFRI